MNNNEKQVPKGDSTALQSENTAIYVNKKLLVTLRSALKRGASRYDILPSDRNLIDAVVREMSKHIIANPVYSKVVPGKDDSYKWFDSDVQRQIAGLEAIKNKGRFVDACIIAYVYGEVGMEQYCVGSRVIYPQKLDQDKLRRIANQAAVIADSKSVESVFVPTTLPLDQE